MGDVGDYWNDVKFDRRQRREKFGVACPRCKEVRPRTCASILMPGQRCKVDGYRDQRSPEIMKDAANG